MKDKSTILKVFVGSRAHGLHDEDSDYDYRAVYASPTTEILSLGHKYKGSHWVEGEKEDQTAWEIAHFLHLATKCNPTILEVFKSPIVYQGYNTSMGIYQQLLSLFPYVWNVNDAFFAFTGYGYNQRKKMLENKDGRAPKYAVAYLRTLYNLNSLLRTGSFDMKVPDGAFRDRLLEIRKGNFTNGQIIDHAEDLITDALIWKEKHELGLTDFKQEPNLEKVNEFLLDVRELFWNGEPDWTAIKRAEHGIPQ